MKGLLIKDLLNLKKQAKIYIFIPLVMFVLSIFSPSVQAFVLVYCVLFAITLPTTALAYDERAKWDRYALSMPVTRRDVVYAKYLLGLVLLLAAVLLTIAVMLVYGAFTGFRVSGVPDIFFTAGLLLCGGGIMLSILLPIMFKLGTEKGRLVMIGIFLVPVLLLNVLASFGFISGMDAIGQAVNKFFVQKPVLPFIGIAAASALCLLLSAAIANAIYKKKEF